MKDDEKSPDFEQDPVETDDVEILEVVGVEVDSTTPAGPPEGQTPEDEPHEILLAFDEDADLECLIEDRPTARDADGGSPRSAPPAAGTPDEILLRLRADYDNLRKRIDRERSEYELYANSTLVGRLLPILDNFERALTLNPPEGAERAFREGFVLIYKQLIDELRREGLRAIASVGETFDPHVHDAVATDAACPEPQNTVVEELRRGYLFQDRVLRPAMVKVSTNGSAPLTTPDKDGEDA